VSRIGKAPVAIPDGVTCTLKDRVLTVKGPKGELTQAFDPSITVVIDQDAGQIRVERSSDKPSHRALHGLSRALINNMVEGVANGYERKLEIVGVGYRAAMNGNAVQLQVGHSHPVIMEPPAGITFAVDGTTNVIVTGIDKQAVGQAAARIRAVRKPEPYKGKGIRYAGEQVRRKEGKSGGKK
jgi:large subunit ribosomal protein L6